MNDLFPIILSVFIFSGIAGMVAGLFLATHIYSKQNKTVLRLKNINEVAQGMFDGEYGERGGLGEANAITFILCESDLTIRKEKLNEECYERMVKNAHQKES